MFVRLIASLLACSFACMIVCCCQCWLLRVAVGGCWTLELASWLASSAGWLGGWDVGCLAGGWGDGDGPFFQRSKRTVAPG